MSLGDRYMNEQLWLHNGSIFGLLGRLLVFAAGFVPLILFVTSLQIWRWRRAAKNRTCAVVQNSQPALRKMD
jgi:uncharacterized iron-regulated membrane protein